MIRTFLNIYNLMIKELKIVLYDKGMLIFIIYVFSVAIYIGGTKTSTELKNGSIAFVDSDKSQLSQRLIDAFISLDLIHLILSLIMILTKRWIQDITLLLF